MTPEEMRFAWQETSECLDKGKGGIDASTFETLWRRRTSLDRLALRYRNSARVAFIMTALSLLMSIRFYYEPDRIMAPSTCIAMAVYFLTCFLMDLWLSRGVASIDCLAMTVSEVSRRAIYYKKKHIQFMIVLIPMAAVVVCLMLSDFSAEKSVMIGAVTGAIAGLACGITIYLRFMRDYKSLIK